MSLSDFPSVIDDDASEITIRWRGRELRGWSYRNDDERRAKMVLAREYLSGWHDGVADAARLLVGIK